MKEKGVVSRENWRGHHCRVTPGCDPAARVDAPTRSLTFPNKRYRLVPSEDGGFRELRDGCANHFIAVSLMSSMSTSSVLLIYVQLFVSFRFCFIIPTFLPTLLLPMPSYLPPAPVQKRWPCTRHDFAGKHESMCCISGVGAVGAIFYCSHMVDACLSHRLCYSEEPPWFCSSGAVGRVVLPPSLLLSCLSSQPLSVAVPAQVSLGHWGKPRRWTGSASWTW